MASSSQDSDYEFFREHFADSSGSEFSGFDVQSVGSLSNDSSEGAVSIQGAGAGDGRAVAAAVASTVDPALVAVTWMDVIGVRPITQFSLASGPKLPRNMNVANASPLSYFI